MGMDLERKKETDLCGKNGTTDEWWYLVVLLAQDQFFPWSDQDVQRKPKEEPIVILRERVLRARFV
jgi:hypothetical protein